MKVKTELPQNADDLFTDLQVAAMVGQRVAYDGMLVPIVEAKRPRGRPIAAIVLTLDVPDRCGCGRHGLVREHAGHCCSRLLTIAERDALGAPSADPICHGRG